MNDPCDVWRHSFDCQCKLAGEAQLLAGEKPSDNAGLKPPIRGGVSPKDVKRPADDGAADIVPSLVPGSLNIMQKAGWPGVPDQRDIEQEKDSDMEDEQTPAPMIGKKSLRDDFLADILRDDVDPKDAYQRLLASQRIARSFTRLPNQEDAHARFREQEAKRLYTFTTAGHTFTDDKLKPALYSSNDIALARQLGDEDGERKWFDRLHQVARAQGLRLDIPTDRNAAARHVMLERIALKDVSLATCRNFSEASLYVTCTQATTFKDGDQRRVRAIVAEQRPDLVQVYVPQDDVVVTADEPQDVGALFTQALRDGGLSDTHAHRQIVAADVAARMKK